MQIYGPSSIHGPHAIQPAHLHRTAQTGEVQRAALPHDEVQISAMGQMLERLSQLPDVRQARIDQIKRELSLGTYETQHKLQGAVERLCEEIG